MKAIELNNITMAFDNFKANDNVTLHIDKNKIHAIIGENGAGKSTLMSILFGFYKQTTGTIKINGKIQKINSPLAANKLGIGMVHQHFKLIENFTVLENIVLNIEETNKIGFISNKKSKLELEILMKRYNLEVDLNKKVSKCTVAEQQRTEILKMLYRDAQILIFDEPTAVLNPLQIQEFLNALKNLKEQGKTIILITHKLDEVKDIADNGTVMRNGKVIKNFKVKNVSIQDMTKMMVGSDINSPKNDYQTTLGHTVLSVNNIFVNDFAKTRHRKLKGISFDVKAGEIVAIAGVSGNGQTELINSVTGMQKVRKGSIDLISKHVIEKTQEQYEKMSSKWQKKYTFNEELNNYYQTSFKKSIINYNSIAKRFKKGISHVPEDRHKYGMVLDMSLWENSALEDIKTKKFSKFGFIKFSKLKQHADFLIKKFDVRTMLGRDSLSRSLSGGNQQKFILAREITRNSSLIVTAQPTRGLDVGAIQKIHKKLLEAKEQGKGILLISYDLDEVMSLADRILVINNGYIAGEVDGKNARKAAIGKLMAGKFNGE